ncbi:MAG TPA: glycogen/starch synthase [Bacteroidales bacterium]|nr:glycogen/starch synthase [Bacteroidales bacterium]
MESIKVLFVSQEITPYLPETEMSLICRTLPQAIQEQGKEIRTFMPRFGCINERRNQLHEVIRLSGMNLIINDTDHPLIIKVASIQSARMQVYFIDNDDYFSRKQTLNDENGEPFPDNDERAVFFCRGVIETVRKLRWSPDIIHCHGWFTALLPLYIKKSFRDDPLFAHSKLVLSAYDDEFTTPFNKNFKQKVLMEGVSKKDLSILDTPEYVNLMKLGVNYADGAVIVNNKVNPELVKHIETSGKPFIRHNNEAGNNFTQDYSFLYDKILEQKHD